MSDCCENTCLCCISTPAVCCISGCVIITTVLSIVGAIICSPYTIPTSYLRKKKIKKCLKKWRLELTYNNKLIIEKYIDGSITFDNFRLIGDKITVIKLLKCEEELDNDLDKFRLIPKYLLMNSSTPSKYDIMQDLNNMLHKIQKINQLDNQNPI